MKPVSFDVLLKYKQVADRLESELNGTLQYLFDMAPACFKNSSHPHKNTLQRNAEHITQGLLTIYLFSIWESLAPSTKEYGSPVFADLLHPGEKMRFYAYKHIRHSAAHSSHGRRANNNRSDFEKFMNAYPNVHGLSWDRSDDTIWLGDSLLAPRVMQLLIGLSRALVIRGSHSLNGSEELPFDLSDPQGQLSYNIHPPDLQLGNIFLKPKGNPNTTA